MSGVSLNVRSSLFWLWICLLPAVDAAAQALPPQAEMVGQIIEIQPAGAKTTIVKHSGQSFAATAFYPLYSGDEVDVPQPGVTATLEFAGGRQVTVAGPAGHYTISVQPPPKTSQSTFSAILAGLPFVLAPPPSQITGELTPRLRLPVGLVSPSQWLPNIEQIIRSDTAQTLLVTWTGGNAEVRVLYGGTPIAITVLKAQEGFAEIACPPLAPGEYSLQIGSGVGGLTIKLLAQSISHTHSAAFGRPALESARSLGGAPSGRLQATADLVTESKTDYLAYALVRLITNHPNRLAGP